MSDDHLNLFCKCCAISCKEMIDFSVEKPSTVANIKTMLEIFQGIEFSDSDIVPNHICFDCLPKLQKCYEFHLKYLQSQNVLQNLLQKIEISEPKIETNTETDFNENEHFIESLNTEILIKSNYESDDQVIQDKDNKTTTSTKSKRPSLRMPKRKYSCYECGKIYKSSRQVTKHTNLHKIPHLCEYCAHLFTNEDTFNDHFKTNHKRFEHYKCMDCKQSLTTRFRFIQHLSHKHKRKIRSFKCTICTSPTNIFIGRYNLLEHIKSHHPHLLSDETATKQLSKEVEMDEEYLDDVFMDENDNTFNSNHVTTEDDVQHIASVDKKKLYKPKRDPLATTLYGCPHCNEKFNKQQPLREHLAHIHDKFSLFCYQCCASFNRAQALEDHKNIHLLNCTESQIFNENVITTIIQNDKTLYECNYCKHRFMKKSNVVKHTCPGVLSAVTKQFKCILCPEVFPTIAKMYAHRKIHKSGNLFKCSQCDKTYTNMIGLKYHQRTHTGGKGFNCPFCNRNFNDHSTMNLHIRSVHAEIKPYACTICDKKFGTADSMKKHDIIVHQRRRDYVCNICGKNYLLSSHLKHHMFSHTKARPYYCDICKKGISRKAYLRKHMMNIHNIST